MFFSSYSKILERAGLTKDEVDLWEINEAFSSMYDPFFLHLLL
jgi:acetyl-CoA acetyltransferase